MRELQAGTTVEEVPGHADASDADAGTTVDPGIPYARTTPPPASDDAQAVVVQDDASKEGLEDPVLKTQYGTNSSVPSDLVAAAKAALDAAASVYELALARYCDAQDAYARAQYQERGALKAARRQQGGRLTL
jgi:hypothetical protein